MDAARVALDQELPPLATSASEARRLLRAVLADAESPDSVDSAQAAISEIVTNALVHAGTAMRLRVLLAGRQVRVELQDGSPRLPLRRGVSALTATGRGLHLVTELVDRWGAYPEGNGKVVWFEIVDEDGERPSADVHVPAARQPDPSETVEVVLLDLPVLMHDAWQEHASGLLREYMLYRLDDDPDALETHASVSNALGLLREQIPGSAVGEHPEEIMAGAIEPRVSIDRLVMKVERGDVDHFVSLHQVLEQALLLADEGVLMSAPTQPEIRLMRRWICEQVWIQGDGGRPTPWASSPDEKPPRSPADLGWDPAGVDWSGRAVIAADDTNTIVAISASALAALGYADRSEIVGRRLIAIIPWRYHQAHVAGFTLHLANGRSPLLGQRVTVPVVRADGSEVEVDVRVESVPLVNGRRVFTAELFLDQP